MKYRRYVLAVILLFIPDASSAHARSHAQVARGAREEARKATPRRHLIVCVDGVGFSLMERMRRQGEFADFRAPSRMIAPFPSVTNVAMARLLSPVGAGEPRGYEDSYFDVTANRTRGTLFDRFRGDTFVEGTFRELFDYHPSALKSGLGYVAPPASTYLEALSDLARLRGKFRAAESPVFFAYTGATDSLAHTGGERLVRRFLRRLSGTLEDLRAEAARRGEELRITIFSDHGNHFRGYRRSDLLTALRRNAYHVGGDLRRERDVVFPRFGLIGCAVLFTREENEEQVALIAARARGVDFAVYERQGVVHVVAATGRATIERRGDRLRYHTLSGDPLGLSSIVERSADAEGFVDAGAWFEHTRDGERPDVVDRIHRATNGQVGNRADVIVSFRDGYYAGSRLLDVFTFLRATHGNIGREQSLGFVSDTARELPGYVRAEGVWAALGDPTINRRAPSVKQSPTPVY